MSFEVPAHSRLAHSPQPTSPSPSLVLCCTQPSTAADTARAPLRQVFIQYSSFSLVLLYILMLCSFYVSTDGAAGSRTLTQSHIVRTQFALGLSGVGTRVAFLSRQEPKQVESMFLGESSRRNSVVVDINGYFGRKGVDSS